MPETWLKEDKEAKNTLSWPLSHDQLAIYNHIQFTLDQRRWEAEPNQAAHQERKTTLHQKLFSLPWFQLELWSLTSDVGGYRPRGPQHGDQGGQ